MLKYAMRPLSILVVDDDERFTTVLRLKLERAGHDVACAEDGAAALEVLQREKFDAVITDILMPFKDGLELIAELRRTQPDTRIIAMSGGGRAPPSHYLDVATGLGAHAVLSKPFSFTELLSALEPALA